MRLSCLLLLGACATDPKSTDDTGPIGGDTDADTDADSDTDTDADGDTDTDVDTDCTAVITSASPASAALDVALDAPVVVSFSEAVTAADIRIDSGVTGAVTLAGDGTYATFVPDADYTYATTYTVSAQVCRDDQSWSFTTVGEALPLDLTDRTYDVELDDSSDLTWVKPSIGSILAGDLQTNSILFMVQSADTSQIDFVASAGYDFRGATAQYPCTYAIDFAPAPYTSHPAFYAGPLDTELEASGVAFDVYDLAISGDIAADGESATDVVITGQLDTRVLSEGLGLDICALATSFGDTCVACPDGEELCMDLEIHDGTAPWRDGLWIDKDHDPSTDRYCD